MNEEQVFEQQSAADDWDGMDFSDLTDDEGTEPDDAQTKEAAPSGESAPEGEPAADQQPGALEAAETGTGEEQTREHEQEGQLFELKHLDETKQATRDEVIALAQKGMDYDRIRANYDEIAARLAAAEKELPELRAHEEFLKEMAGGRTIEEMIDDVRASALESKLGIDHETALGRVRLDRERRQFEAEKNKAGAQQRAAQEQAQRERAQTDAQEQWKKDCFLEFAKHYPAVDPKRIPQEVWTAFGKGETLVSAYSRIRLRELETKQAAQQQEAENAKRSTGSRQSAGKASRQDAFDAAWYDGT